MVRRTPSLRPSLRSIFSFMPRADLQLGDARFEGLLLDTLSRIPLEIPPVVSLKRISLRRRGSMKGVVGLTKYSFDEYKLEGAEKWETPFRGTHTVTFYTGLLDQLSDEAVEAVMAHEFAHAWLNEYIRPEQSSKREHQADRLAGEWGFEHELEALASETDPVE